MNKSTMSLAPSQYVAKVLIFNNIAFVSGQLPRESGEIKCFGKVGGPIELAAAQQAAALCARACINELDVALGGLEQIVQVIKLTGFVACTPDFTSIGQVIDGASKVLIDLLGPAGTHSRSAIGVQQLPHGATVEVELIVGLRS